MKMKWRGIIFSSVVVFFVLFGCLQAAKMVPDTGQVKCYDAGGAVISPCPAPGAAFHGQDAHYNVS